MRRVNVSTLSLAALPAAFFLLTSCAGSAHDPAEKYILVASHMKIAYWQAAAQGLSHAAAEMKVKSEVQGPDEHDAQGEHDAFRRAIAEKPSGILVSASDAAVLTPDINAAIDQGIPVITIDSDAPESKRLFFVGTDNYNAGLLGGKLTAKLLGGKGNVAFFTMDQPNLKDRLHGYQSAFADHTDVKIMQTTDTNGNSDVAFDTTKKLIDSKAKVDAFVCLEAIACSAVADVVNRAGMGGKMTIVAMDTDPSTIDWINKGVISATIAQKPYTMAYYGTKLLADLHLHPPTPLAGDWGKNVSSPIPTFVDTGAFVVDKSNVGTLSKQQSSGQ
ncbi:MAG TPA: substrate-binding domain-containing protein [Bryobacteraceae bacterium]|nr:substrate-binding domain-containing protein [Bryobacteraceae bacterium]